jgi:hypothetical protein
MAKRRAKGEGSVYIHEKRKYWVGQFNLPDGKTKYSICVHINAVLGDIELSALKANHLQMM